MAAWATTALVGRLGELERLEEGIREAGAGRGGTVLVAGDAGIGKTRLVTELGARARATGARTLVGRCIDLVGAEVPYLPVAEALRPLVTVTTSASCWGRPMSCGGSCPRWPSVRSTHGGAAVRRHRSSGCSRGSSRCWIRPRPPNPSFWSWRTCRARRDPAALTARLDRALQLRNMAREAATEAAAVTPTAAAWRAVAEAEHDRAQAHPNLGSWEEAAAMWEALQRPPIVAYCRWRQAEALVAAGASAADTALPIRAAHATAQRLGARPLKEEIQRLAQRARLDLAPPDHPADQDSGLAELLGLTPHEAEVLGLVARGYTNRQIAAALVISVKTASVHVSHILGKLDAQNRVEAAAIAHRFAPATPAAPSEPPG